MADLAAAAFRFLVDPKSQPVGDNGFFARLVVEKPLLRAGSVWIVSRHDLVTKLARHPDCLLRMPDAWAETDAADPAVARFLDGLMPIQPPPEHRRLRRLLSAEFSAHAVARLRARIRDITAELFAGPLDAGECELVDDVCGPLPVYSTVALLGLPDSDRPSVLRWARAINGLVLNEVTTRLGGRYGDAAAGTGAGSLAEVVSYIEDLVRHRTAHPGTDLISRLTLQSNADDGKLSHEELVSTVLMLFLTGIDTVGSQLANVVIALDRHRDAWRRVVADPTRAPAAYLEGIRLLPALPVMGRIAGADIDLGGAVIPAGNTVLLAYAAANLDPTVFADPTRFDLDRADGSGHLSFGHGPHYCLGAALAKLQGEAVLDVLARQAPDFAIVGGLGTRRQEMAFHSVAELRLRLSDASRPTVGAGSRP